MTYTKPVFPYTTMHSAVATGFDQLGGPEEALRYLRLGFLYAERRKQYDQRARDKALAEDEEFKKTHKL